MAGKRGEDGAAAEEDDVMMVVEALQMCPEDMMDCCDADEIASEHQSNEGGESSKRAAKLKA